MENTDVIFDIETKKSFDDVGGKDHLAKLGVSVLGAYFTDSDSYETFEEHEIPKFEERIIKARRLIGFNIHHFDLPVLQPYILWDLRRLSTLDLMSDIERGAGFRISLDNLCDTTLGEKKSADGMQAIRWYQEGKINLIKEYCLKDVKLTKMLYEFGREHGHVLFFSKSAMGRVAIPVHWGGDAEESVRAVIYEGHNKRRSVEIEYVSKIAHEANREAISHRLVDVYKILDQSFEGYCHLRKSRRIFKIDSVISAHLTDKTYNTAEDVQVSLI